MIHSSELMPGGSPYFNDSNAIDKMYDTMDELFAFARKLGYEGETLESYTKQFLKK